MRPGVRRHLTLAVPSLIHASVLNQLRAEMPERFKQVDFGGNKTVAVGVAEDVLYVPALHLQVWRNRIVPYEANPSDAAFAELQSASRTGAAIAHVVFSNVQQYDEDVCVLSNLYSHEFIHFLEELYKVTVLERSGFTGRYVFSSFPTRISQDLPGFSIELLEALGITQARVAHLGKPTLLRSAWLTTPITHIDAPAYGEIFVALRDRLIAAADGPGLLQVPAG